MKYYVDKYAVCPFYLQEWGVKIHCSEGYVKGNQIELAFSDKVLKKMHKKQYCNCISGYSSCPFYSVINKKYL